MESEPVCVGYHIQTPCAMKRSPINKVSKKRLAEIASGLRTANGALKYTAEQYRAIASKKMTDPERAAKWSVWLRYDEDTGLLYWKERLVDHFKTPRDCQAWNTRFAGEVAGRTSVHGYIEIAHNGLLYKAHRIIVEMFDGPIPKGIEVDHADGDKTNNRRSNLRRCTKAQNMWNTDLSSRNTIGHKHVFHGNGGYIVRLVVNGRSKHFGTFQDLEDAKRAANAAILTEHKQFANKGSAKAKAMKAADRWFSEWIRLRDAGPDGRVKCITCSRVAHWRTMQSGHYASRAKQATRYDERNAHAQCAGCNMYQGGKFIEHAAAIGSSLAAEIAQKAMMPCKRTADDFQRIADDYHARILIIRDREPMKYHRQQ
jgi:hypothetical protein